MRKQLVFLLAVFALTAGGCPTPSIVLDDDDSAGDDDDSVVDDDDSVVDDDDSVVDDDDSVVDDDDSVVDDDDSVANDDDSVVDDDDSVADSWFFGDLIITEALLNATGNDDDKEWFELFNNSGMEVDLQGLVIRDDGTDSFTVSTSVIVPDGAFVVLGQTADTSLNGGVTVDYEYGLGGMTLGNSDDELIVESPNGTLIDSILWDNGATFPDPNGETMSLDPLSFDATLNDTGSNWCESPAPPFGTNGDLGTPGSDNPSCTVIGDDDDSAGDDDDSAGDDDDSAGDDDDSAGDDDDSAGDDDDSAGDDDDSAGDDDDSAGDDDDSAGDDDDSAGDDDDSATGDDDDSATGDDDDSATGDDDDSATGDDDDSATGDDDDSATGDDDDSAASNCSSDPWINELHYDNAGGDTNEGIEMAGLAGTDLTGWTIELYNGSNNSLYSTITLSGTLPNDGSGLGATWFAHANIQNGGPDGFALIDPLGLPLGCWSYEGTFTPAAGACNGIGTTDIGVQETGGTAAGESLQLGGTGCSPTDFTWQAPQTNTAGAVNAGQTFAM